MSLAYTHERLQLPEGAAEAVARFRRRVWTIKMVEAAAAAVFGILVAYLLMFLLDRAWDTPIWVRAMLSGRGGRRLRTVPVAVHRWIWRNRRLEQLARLLEPQAPAGRRPVAGHHRAGAHDFEQARVSWTSARRPSARWPRTPSVGISRDCGAEPSPSALGVAWWPCPLVLTIGLCAGLPGRGPERLGAVARSLGQHAPLHVRRPGALAGPDGRRPRRAVHGHGEARGADRLAAPARAKPRSTPRPR